MYNNRFIYNREKTFFPKRYPSIIKGDLLVKGNVNDSLKTNICSEKILGLSFSELLIKISLSLFFLLLSIAAFTQSPHGEKFEMNCAACHTSDSWEIPLNSWDFDGLVNPIETTETTDALPQDPTKFNHNDTNFPLEGGHAATDCRLCHADLVFTETAMECISCHTDMHNMTVGTDCARCHTVDNWLVDNITEIHQDNGFPLLGSHAQLGCTECHISDTQLQFHPLGTECINCHMGDFLATTMPNHVDAGYSTECMDCHDINAFSWSANILHDFFPLQKGHDIGCMECHTSGTFEAISSDCISCHEMDYDMALNPNHKALNFGTDCAACHTLDLDWMPAEYKEHDNEYFPIYSGEHAGEWSDCIECHPNPSNYKVFTCTTCHGKSETDGEHNGVGGYVYESGACLACHPNGDGEGNFDHNNTNFPLTGAHISVDCNSCHANGYAGTPTECSACHTMDFEQTTSPDHQQLGFSMDCASCHTTDPNWMPATFADHDNYYVLNGAHKQVSCSECHNATFTNTPTTCFGCHESDYNNANDPDHNVANFPTDCTECHTENAWEPTSWDHDNDFFPIYSGNHQNEWNECVDCHINPGNYAIFSCIDCHEHNDPNDLADEHEDVPNYEFISTKCLECHPNGD